MSKDIAKLSEWVESGGTPEEMNRRIAEVDKKYRGRVIAHTKMVLKMLEKKRKGME